MRVYFGLHVCMRIVNVNVLQVRVGICIWLAKFLRMSRPDLVTRNAEPADVPGESLSSLTPTSARGCSSARLQAPSASKSAKKFASSTKSAELFQRQSSRSLLANVLDLEDNFLLLNLRPTAVQRGWWDASF